MQVLAPAPVLKALAELPSVRYLGLPARPFPQIVSEGVQLTGAGGWHSSGYDGAGVKVAVLDLGFKSYSSLLGVELPPQVTVRSFRADGDIEADENHGTACAEIVYDMAPQATLYLVNFSTLVEFGNAVAWLIDEGVDIISHSIGWFNVGPGDGSGPVGDIVNMTSSHGILWVNAAGNYAQRHWAGNWVDANGGGWHDFTGTDETNTVAAQAGETIMAFLRWDDPWDASTNDYDLCLFDEALDEPVAWSANVQDGSQSPEEAIIYTAPVSGVYHIAIYRWEASRDVGFDLFCHSHILQHQVAAGSLISPSEAPTALAVGAVRWNSPDALEYFSSQGPTRDGRLKPDMVAPDGVATASYGMVGFYGTSACAPHMAGAAALLKQKVPAYTPEQLQAYLENNAVDLGDQGKDNLFGAGRLTLYEKVVFPDPNLEAAIRQAIAKPAGDIYTSDLAGLEGLDASERGIADLTGIEQCPDIIWLDLSGNQVVDISPLVNNSGLGTGDEVWLDGNLLALWEGAKDLNDIRTLENRGITVHCESATQAGAAQGEVRLQGRSDHSGSSISFQIEDEALATTIQDTSGSYLVNGIPQGTYRVVAELPGFLPAALAGVAVQSGQTAGLPPVRLLAGDVNEDKAIDINDLALVASDFNNSQPQSSADINLDSIVDVFDLVMVGANYGRTSSPWSQ